MFIKSPEPLDVLDERALHSKCECDPERGQEEQTAVRQHFGVLWETPCLGPGPKDPEAQGQRMARAGH